MHLNELDLCCRNSTPSRSGDLSCTAQPHLAVRMTLRNTHTGADPVAALLLAAPAAGPVSLSVINGRVIVRDGEILGFDLPALVADGEARSARLVSMLTPAAIGAGAV